MIFEASQPHCPDDGVVMRDDAGGWRCPECGHVQQAHDAGMPPEFEGPDLDEFRQRSQ